MRDDAESEPWDGSIISIREVTNDMMKSRPGEPWGAIGGSVMAVIPVLREQAERLGDTCKAYSFCHEAVGIVGELNSAIRGLDEPRHGLWSHQKRPTATDGAAEERSINKEALELVVVRYLACEWHSDHLEWCMVDALAFCECYAFIFHLRMTALYRRLGLVAWAVIGAVTGTTLWFVFGNNQWVWGAGVVVLGLISTGARARSDLKNARRPLAAMLRAYQELDGAALSLIRVRDRLQAAEADGVVWPTAIWPILDATIARNARVWKPWG